MNLFTLRRLVAVLFVLVFINVAAPAELKAPRGVSEKDVRAELGFLASDAMQGRGSGGPYEHVAAEYVGSQFMQFGLEPAGEPGWDGKPSYVQTVTFARNMFAESPTLKFGSTVLQHGKEMIVWRTTQDAGSGVVQLLSAGAKPNRGAVVLMATVPGEESNRNSINTALDMALAGALVVVIEDSPAWHPTWNNFASRQPSYTTTSAAGSSSGGGWTLIVASKEAFASLKALPPGSRAEFGGKLSPVEPQHTWNAIGKLTGSNPSLSSEVILLSSHLDHLGVRPNAPGEDKIYNGADDNASGTVAVLEMARLLAGSKRPKRTVYFVSFGSEESGGYGAGYFVNNLPFPKEKLVANLEFEMIGRPDTAVRPDELWLTGYERSNLGPELAKRGAKLVQDPHPDQNFFTRSDNYTLARQGIIAHTVSSYGLHKDYHQPSDELKTIDFGHMLHAINSMVAPVIWLVNSDFKPAWNQGKKP